MSDLVRQAELLEDAVTAVLRALDSFPAVARNEVLATALVRVNRGIASPAPVVVVPVAPPEPLVKPAPPERTSRRTKVVKKKKGRGKAKSREVQEAKPTSVNPPLADTYTKRLLETLRANPKMAIEDLARAVYGDAAMKARARSLLSMLQRRELVRSTTPGTWEVVP